MMRDPKGGQPVPTPEEIREACMAMKEGWTESEERAHRQWQVRINDDGQPGIVRTCEEEGIRLG
jgi:hypothetical protein